jgi:hypothetical protein
MRCLRSILTPVMDKRVIGKSEAALSLGLFSLSNLWPSLGDNKNPPSPFGKGRRGDLKAIFEREE